MAEIFLTFLVTTSLVFPLGYYIGASNMEQKLRKLLKDDEK